jgi:hypothetical protein
MTERELYLGDVLASFQNGVQMDLRVKLAIEFLKGGSFLDARTALGAATDLVSEAERLGLMKPLPEDDELPAAARRHIRRQVRAQVYGQIAAQKIGPEEQPKIAASNGFLPAVQ